MHWVLAAILALFVQGCSRPPKTPSLDRLPQSRPSEMLLGSRLSAANIRTLFAAINHDGRLDSLIPFVENLSESELASLSTWFSRFFYESAEDSTGFIELLEKKIAAGFFKRLESEVFAQLREPETKESFRALNYLLTSKPVPALARKASGFLSPDWTSLVSELSRRNLNSMPVEEPLPGWAKGKIYDDLARFLFSETAPALVPVATKLTEIEFESALLTALHKFGNKHGVHGFRGVEIGLSRMLPEFQENGLAMEVPAAGVSSLLKFAERANAPSAGMFSEIQKAVCERPDLLAMSELLLSPLLSSSLTGFSEKILSQVEEKEKWLSLGKRKESFREVFTLFQEALQGVTSKIRDPQDFISTYPVYIPAYVLTRWIEQVVTENKDRQQWVEAPASGFGKIVWDLPVVHKGTDITFSLMDLRWHEDFRTLGLGTFADTLKSNLQAGSVPITVYKLPEVTEPDTSLRQGTKRVITALHEVRPIADSTIFLKQTFLFLCQPSSKHSFTLAAMETDNLLGLLHEKLSLPLDSYRRLKQLLVEDINNETFYPALREFLVLVYSERPDLLEKLNGLLDGIPSFLLFDSPVDKFPSAFEAYHTLLRSLSPDSLPYLGEALVFIAQSKGLEIVQIENRGRRALYPSLMGRFKTKGWLASRLGSLSTLTPSEQRKILAPWVSFKNENLPESLISALQLAQSLLKAHATGVRILLTDWESGKPFLFSEKLSELDMKWLAQALGQHSTEQVWSLLIEKGSKEGTLAFARELKALQSSGALRRGLLLLSQVPNPRIQRLAQVLMTWEFSGELGSFLRTVEALIGL